MNGHITNRTLMGLISAGLFGGLKGALGAHTIIFGADGETALSGGSGNDELQDNGDIPLPSDADVQKLIDAIHQQWSNKHEVGAVLLEDRVTGKQRLKVGKDAGKSKKDDFEFRFFRKSGEKIVGFAHSHLKPTNKDGKKLKGDDNQIPSKDDREALIQKRAPVITVGREIITILYMMNGQPRVKVIEGKLKTVHINRLKKDNMIADQ